MAVSAAVVAMTLGVPAAAGAVTFGTNLDQPANNTVTCGQGFAPFFQSYPSCTYFSSAPGPTFYAPVSGTVTAVRVRVGAVTGPMQIVVMRSLYQNHAGDPGHPYFACCFIERYGPEFVPQAGTVTTVPTSLPMTEEPTPPPEDTTTNAAGDFLALSVLASNVPIPLFIDNQSFDSGFYPAPTPSTTPAPSPNPLFESTAFQGGQILMNADLDTGGGGGGAGGGAAGGGGPPGGGGAPGGVGKAGPPPIPAIGLPSLTIPVAGNTATVPLQCLVVDCTGTLALQNTQLAGVASAAKARKRHKKKAKKLVSYGSASFSVKAGTTGNVKIKLDGAGRKLLKGHKTARVWANVRFSALGGAPRSIPVTLKR